MRKAFKFLILPIAFTCCSMTSNTRSIRINSFAIVDEDKEASTFKLCAYVDIIRAAYDKNAFYRYSYVDKNNEFYDCGAGSFSIFITRVAYPLAPSKPIDAKKLIDCCPVTFTCEMMVNEEPTYYKEMVFNNKTIDRFEINESTNHQELNTGYVQSSTFPDSSKNYQYEDVITFLNFEDLRVNELYYDLDISYLRFKYRNGLDNIPKGNFRFAFYDRYNLFPDFPIGEESMYRYITLKLNQDEDEYFLTFADTIYYDPTTHVSSLFKKDNYLPSNRLILPFKNASELKFLPCYIELKINSHANFTIHGKFTFTYFKKYYGYCEDSEYCEQIRQNEEVNVREKVVEVVL